MSVTHQSTLHNLDNFVHNTNENIISTIDITPKYWNNGKVSTQNVAVKGLMFKAMN